MVRPGAQAPAAQLDFGANGSSASWIAAVTIFEAKFDPRRRRHRRESYRS